MGAHANQTLGQSLNSPAETDCHECVLGGRAKRLSLPADNSDLCLASSQGEPSLKVIVGFSCGYTQHVTTYAVRNDQRSLRSSQ